MLKSYTDTSDPIKYVTYDQEYEILQIIFRKGPVYLYKRVPYEIYTKFIRADSKGRFFLDHIRTEYDYICKAKEITLPTTPFKTPLKRKPFRPPF